MMYKRLEVFGPEPPERGYRYFDTPDGEDLFKKLWLVAKPAFFTGIFLSTADVLCFEKHKSYTQVAGRYAFITLPLVGIASTFVITSNLAAQQRKKDDIWNWGLGGAVSGGLVGAWRRSAVAGFSAAAGLAFLAIVRKDLHERGWELVPENIVRMHGGVQVAKMDWTLMKERPRNWTTGRE
ncbi:uncharacterized protein [Onthophagus taurus]|uniref:uncharacterized protein n=1 Tax=Onthophagus taurus TaxID=166361 RepID=UPI000C2000C4|nr:uncharacterized protein LOC111429162 [Onthophagus taurus]